MGLTVRIKGYEGAYNCGYITMGNFLMKLCKTAYGERMGEMFSRFFTNPYYKGFSEEEAEFWNQNCDDGIDLLLWHSDCDSKFTPEECRTIYESIKDLHMDMVGHNYDDMKPYNMLDRWKDMFLYCAKHRVNMYFT